MKYSVVFLFALAVASSLSTGNAAPPSTCDPCADNSLKIGVGTLFASYIYQCVDTVAQFILQIVLQFIPGDIPVPLADVLSALSCEPNLTVCILFQAVANAIGVNIVPILTITPVAILNTPISLDSLLEYLAPTLAQCPSGVIEFGQLGPLAVQYLTQEVAQDLVGLFDAIPSL